MNVGDAGLQDTVQSTHGLVVHALCTPGPSCSQPAMPIYLLLLPKPCSQLPFALQESAPTFPLEAILRPLSPSLCPIELCASYHHSAYADSSHQSRSVPQLNKQLLKNGTVSLQLCVPSPRIVSDIESKVNNRFLYE